MYTWSATVNKGDNFHDFLLDFLRTKHLLKIWSTEKETVCSQAFRLVPFSENEEDSCLPWKCIHFFKGKPMFVSNAFEIKSSWQTKHFEANIIAVRYLKKKKKKKKKKTKKVNDV